ncbi:hypothetical protein L6164_031240 [Bauhinia variegata]|uniref:Uncharacterized protein n=1 Tax=Bauhinia variegata TaxID=167791 RepID=A0ACB9LFQ4_BAUVA|nr:hypothetical protein L6164_031240 [Bauhinia variegata]
MKNSQRTGGVRKYHKSELPRLRWTPELHRHFVEAVKSLGGKNKATPKRILQIMHARGLRISHIKSHLQMYRNMKENGIRVSVDPVLEGTAHHANDLKSCSICSPQRSARTELWATSNYDRNIAKEEFYLLDKKLGFSQTSEETDYDLNQEPQSSTCLLSDISNEEDNDGETKFHELPALSLSTPLIPIMPMMHSTTQETMRFPSPTSADNHILDSSAIQSFGSTYVNLDLTI